MSIVFDPIGKTALYRLYDIQGVLLYVGVSDELKTRFKAHAASKTWWPSVHSRRIEWFDDRAVAEDAERAAINDEHPLWNNRDSPWQPVVVAGGKHAVAPKRANLPATPASRLLASPQLAPLPPCVGDGEQATTDDLRHGPYLRVLKGLLKVVRRGDPAPGGRLPSERALGEAFAVHRSTISRVMEKLRWIGLVTGPPGGIARVAEEPGLSMALELIDRTTGIRHLNECVACATAGVAALRQTA